MMTRLFTKGLALIFLFTAESGYARSEVPVPPAGSQSVARQPDPASVADLRLEYENLRRREAALAALSEPATARTRKRLEDITRQLEELPEPDPLDIWKAQTMTYFRDSLKTAGALTLPPETPRGLELALAPAEVIQESVTYYSAPGGNSASLGSATQAKIVMHVADAGGYSLVWDPDVGFVFVVQHFLKVYR